MNKILFLSAALLFFVTSIFAQAPGDTIVVNAFNYNQTYGTGIRDTVLNFPNDPTLQYEKIIMLYNMRCKGGVVGSQVPPNGTAGCGEWDYSCNTYITDSTRQDTSKATHPTHILPGFTGNVFDYTNVPTYTYTQHTQQNVVYTSTISETVSTVGTSVGNASALLLDANKAGKSQFLWTAAELIAAGVTAGDITGLKFNVSQVGSGYQYLKVKMKHTPKDTLKENNPDLTGFTEVYFLNTNVASGLNQLNFYNNFNWNGTDNVLVELSFTNLSTGVNTAVAYEATSNDMGLVSPEHDYAPVYNGGSLTQLNANHLTGFSDEISIAFWSYGDSVKLPRNTSAFHCQNNQNLRQLNAHFPWNNSRVYWDAGDNNNYDRINKAATTDEIKGQWNYYVFTKNATTGVMNIYLNGVLWHTGTGKTKAFQLDNFVIGANNTLGNAYFGKIDDFSLWNTELTAAEVQDWMYRKIDATHPSYANLKAYYALNEGTGNTVDNTPSGTSSVINGLANWSLIHGEQMFKNFRATTSRPIISFVQGTYTQTITPVTILDSIENFKQTVFEYVINGNNVVPFDTNYYYQAGYTYVYDATSGQKIDSVLNATQNTININTLNYYNSFPARYQIMSFVTPYGNGLNLGPDGKTWTFDLTDFAPILKGDKRMTMDAGGQWQEDMDIKFLFIVGTPPRDVLDINNIWRVESTNNANIINDDRYEPVNFPLKANANSFKIRSAITGHGQEGEFISRSHNININGGTPEFVWDVWKECAENPVYPQGGTWIYDRAGWCPGMATDVQEFDITPHVTPGQSALIDYDMVSATGTSRYWVSHQLVEYGAANFTSDAALVEIKNPTNRVEYARENPFCKDPIVVIRNTGSNTLTSLKIEYWVNDQSNSLVYTWNGSLDFMEEAEIALPSAANLYATVDGSIQNKFFVEISEPNAGTDEYVHNNKLNSEFEITEVVPSDFIVWVKTNNYGSQTSYRILDAGNNVVFSKSGLGNNITYLDTLSLGTGCYSFEIYDTGNDGLSFWANPNQGSGFARLRSATGAIVEIFPNDFGGSYKYSFTINYALSNTIAKTAQKIKLYPNPADNQFVVAGKDIDKKQIKIYNNLGQQVAIPFNIELGKVRFDSSSLPIGLYQIVVFDTNGDKQTQKLLID